MVTLQARLTSNGSVLAVRPRKPSKWKLHSCELVEVVGRVQWGKQVRDRCCVQRLGLMKIPKGQGTARRHSVGTNTVDHSPKQRQRGAWRGVCSGENQVPIGDASNG